MHAVRFRSSVRNVGALAVANRVCSTLRSAASPPRGLRYLVYNVAQQRRRKRSVHGRSLAVLHGRHGAGWLAAAARYPGRP